MPLPIALNITSLGVILNHGESERGIFVPPLIDTYPQGLVLGRLTANDKFVPYVSGAADGSEIPVAVLMEELVAPTASVDVPQFVMLAGRVRESGCRVWNAGTPIALTAAERDEMRRQGIVVSLSDTATETNFDNAI